MVGKETFWAYPVCDRLEDVLAIDLGADNLFARTVNEMTRRSVACSTGHHFVACYPMVGIADILAGLYGTEKLLLAMLEEPLGVRRAMQHLTRLWLEEFERVSALIESAGNPGHMTWMAIWAPGRACATQEDFSYMISGEMYRQFCLPPLMELIDSLAYAMYHLDGPGALTHLDTLLSIPKLRAIQWVPGAGREAVPHWYELIHRILEGGKSVEVFARPEEVPDLVREVGSRGLLIHCGEISEEEADWLLEAYPQEGVSFFLFSILSRPVASTPGRNSSSSPRRHHPGPGDRGRGCSGPFRPPGGCAPARGRWPPAPGRGRACRSRPSWPGWGTSPARR